MAAFKGHRFQQEEINVRQVLKWGCGEKMASLMPRNEMLYLRDSQLKFWLFISRVVYRKQKHNLVLLAHVRWVATISFLTILPLRDA